MPVIEDRINVKETYDDSQELLNTIKFPQNIKNLNLRLPKSQYQDNEELESMPSTEKKSRLMTKISQPILLKESQNNISDDVQRELDKYAAIAEIEKKYADYPYKRSRKHKQIPKTTPSSQNGIPNLYKKYREKAKGIAEAMQKKQSYLQLKEKYARRAKEVEELEHKNILINKRIAESINHSRDYGSPDPYKNRNNYHYNLPEHSKSQNSHILSKSENYREKEK